MQSESGAFGDADGRGASVLQQTLIAIVGSTLLTSLLMWLAIGVDMNGVVGVGRIWAITLLICTLAPALLCPLIAIPAMRGAEEVRRVRNELALAAFKDPLTGLLNRRGFEQAAARILDEASQPGAVKVVMMCDLDFFKSVNDRFGHEYGDQALEETARRIAACLHGRNALVCRRGGEEFAVLTIGADAEDAEGLGEAIRAACSADPILWQGQGTQITISLGVAVAAAGWRDLKEMLRRADEALYRAKAGGRNRVVMSPALAGISFAV